MSVQDAMNYADKLHQRVVDDFLEISKSFDAGTIAEEDPRWDGETREQTRRYLDALAKCARGCDAWSSESARYGLSEAFHETRIVKVLPPKGTRAPNAKE